MNNRLIRHFGLLAAAAAVAIGIVLILWRFSSVSPELPPVQPSLVVGLTSPEFRPVEQPDDGYVGSAVCRECHSDKHASWYASYHRTMTQVATPKTVFGEFDDTLVTTHFDGRRYHLRTSNGHLSFTVEESASSHDPGRAYELPIVMVTGSHHMQVYWYATGKTRTLGMLPIVYLKDEKRWVPRADIFLQPPVEVMRAKQKGIHAEFAQWNTACIHCHTTHGRVREMTQEFSPRFDTRAAEFGISCEACHGPGERHVDFHRSALQHRADGIDPIVNPAKLSSQRASQICGYCHSAKHFQMDEATLARVNMDGHPFRPGDDLHQLLPVVQVNKTSRQLYAASPEAESESFDDWMRHRFWSDGMVRVSGREYNGLLESACFQTGEMSCMSCHAMHLDKNDPTELQEWANDQLRPGMRGDDACLQCHNADAYHSQVHTHHSTESSGSRCMNCHMSYTSYGLIKAIRSHQIDSPDVATSLKTGRPNACNQCHLDRSLGWSAIHLSDWYGISKPKFTEDERHVAAMVLWALTGDAGQRALAAWSLGWAPAVEVSGSDWLAPILCRLMDDEYSTVRLIAFKSLRRLPDFADVQYDFVAAPNDRAAVIREIMDKWTGARKPVIGGKSSVLINSDGRFIQTKAHLLNARRDNRPLFLYE